MQVPWSPVEFGKSEIDAAKKVLESTWVTQGKITERFEKDISDYVGSKHAIVVNSGTSALISALLAHGIGPGDEVLVPSFTFIASINTILAVGAKPILVDSDASTFNTNSDHMRKYLTKKTKAILPVDVAGLSIDIDDFKNFAEEENLIFIEDAAEALGSEYKGKRIGSFNHTSIFSFHMAKLATTIEGGCILTNDDDLAEHCRSIRNHGMAGRYEHKFFGLNFRITDIQSAIGRVQISKIDKFIEHRNKMATIYRNNLHNLVDFQHLPDYSTVHSYMLFGILVDSNKRDSIISKLNEKGIGTRICWPHTIEQEYHSGLFNSVLPNAKLLSERIINLPMGNAITIDQVNYVCKILKEILEE